jgi:hypothetical protein
MEAADGGGEEEEEDQENRKTNTEEEDERSFCVSAFLRFCVLRLAFLIYVCMYACVDVCSVCLCR